MHKGSDPIIKGKYKVTTDTRVIPIVEHKHDVIQWAFNKLISIDTGDPDTPKEKIFRPIGYLWKMSAVSEINNIISIKNLIPIKITTVKSKGRKIITILWAFKSKTETCETQ